MFLADVVLLAFDSPVLELLADKRPSFVSKSSEFGVYCIGKLIKITFRWYDYGEIWFHFISIGSKRLDKYLRIV